MRKKTQQQAAANNNKRPIYLRARETSECVLKIFNFSHLPSVEF